MTCTVTVFIFVPVSLQRFVCIGLGEDLRAGSIDGVHFSVREMLRLVKHLNLLISILWSY